MAADLTIPPPPVPLRGRGRDLRRDGRGLGGGLSLVVRCDACGGRMFLEERVTGNSTTDGQALVCILCGHEVDCARPRQRAPWPPARIGCWRNGRGA